MSAICEALGFEFEADEWVGMEVLSIDTPVGSIVVVGGTVQCGTRPIGYQRVGLVVGGSVVNGNHVVVRWGESIFFYKVQG